MDHDKQEMLRRMARAYLRGFPEKLRADVPVRFDVVSVYLLASGVEFELYRGSVWMVKYARETEIALLEPAELSERLAAVFASAMPWLVTLSEAEASVPEREGKWSAKQVIGHLIDSAVNNLGRIVRMQIEEGPH